MRPCRWPASSAAMACCCCHGSAGLYTDHLLCQHFKEKVSLRRETVFIKVLLIIRYSGHHWSLKVAQAKKGRMLVLIEIVKPVFPFVLHATQGSDSLGFGYC